MGPLVAIIPVKGLARAKTRLAGMLSLDARAALMRNTLERAVRALQTSEAVARIVIVTRDPVVADWAKEWGVDVLRERQSGLNGALREARDTLNGAGAMLIVPGDIGLLAGNDVAAIIALAGRPPAVVIAPDRHERGTNALLLAPPDAMDVAFGPGSARRHAALAQAAGIEPAWYRSGSIGLDVDDADDLALYAGLRLDLHGPG
ncbi:MAG: 2-phospho-L-lactate guanylyltransferase [Thermoflexales bacterium]